ncbi:MAG: transporter substrate-binding domain-containing protein [Gallionella sp.]|nr:transporter substrate-binding domain-containing protein [Gallionella sp.]
MTYTQPDLRSQYGAWLWYVLLLLACCLPLSALCATSSPSVRLCVSEFPPYNSVALPDNGAVVKIATEAFRRSGYEVQIVFLPWTRVIMEAERGECGILGLWRNSTRDVVYIYSHPIASMELGLFGRVGVTHDLGQSSSLQSLVIGVERGSYISPILENKKLRFEPTVDLVGSLRMLAKGRVDLTFGARVAGEYIINRPLGTGDELKNQVEWKTPALETKDFFLASNKTHKQQSQLLHAFNQGLASTKVDGMYRKLLQAVGLHISALP